MSFPWAVLQNNDTSFNLYFNSELHQVYYNEEKGLELQYQDNDLSEYIHVFTLKRHEESKLISIQSTNEEVDIYLDGEKIDKFRCIFVDHSIQVGNFFYEFLTINDQNGLTFPDSINQFYIPINLLNSPQSSRGVFKVFSIRSFQVQTAKFAKRWQTKSSKHQNIEKLREEYDLLKKIQSPHVVKVFDFVVASDDLAFISMQFCSALTLEHQLYICNQIKEQDVVAMLYKLLIALEHLNHIGITHRNICPRNIAFSRRNSFHHPILIDFGNADSRESMTGFVGSFGFAAPEMMLQRKELRQSTDDVTYTRSVDLYSVFVTSFNTFYAALPFGDAIHRMRYLKNALSFQLQISDDVMNNATPAFRKLLESVLLVSTDQRPTTDSLKEQMEANFEVLMIS